MSPTGIRSVWEKKDDSKDPSPRSGYLIGPGDVYGGDYTIYPTHDPSTSHALATVNVLPAPTVRHFPLQLTSRVPAGLSERVVGIQSSSKSGLTSSLWVTN
jgi:hypothetical protein